MFNWNALLPCWIDSPKAIETVLAVPKAIAMSDSSSHEMLPPLVAGTDPTIADMPINSRLQKNIAIEIFSLTHWYSRLTPRLLMVPKPWPDRPISA